MGALVQLFLCSLSPCLTWKQWFWTMEQAKGSDKTHPALFRRLFERCSLQELFCFVYIEWQWVLLFSSFPQWEHSTCSEWVSERVLFEGLFRVFLSLNVCCAGCAWIARAKPSECAAMIMVQGQECQLQRWELVIFKSPALLPWLLLNVSTAVKHCSEPCAQLHSVPSKTNRHIFTRSLYIHKEDGKSLLILCSINNPLLIQTL